MKNHTTVTVHEDTHLALKRVCEIHEYESMHQFILQQVLKTDEANEQVAIPTGLRRALERRANDFDESSLTTPANDPK